MVKSILRVRTLALSGTINTASCFASTLVFFVWLLSSLALLACHARTPSDLLQLSNSQDEHHNSNHIKSKVGLEGLMSHEFDIKGNPQQSHIHDQVKILSLDIRFESSIQETSVRSHGRGLVAGILGSTPPKCISKCSKCTPCQPVRVPIQPGRTKVGFLEYYPEAWRCKCKNKIYMP